MTEFAIKLFLSVLCFGALLLMKTLSKPSNVQDFPIRTTIAVYAIAQIGIFLVICANHLPFLFHLEIMEGTVLQHFERAVNFEPIYIAPSPDYVPLAYNPLYYYFSIPFSWVFGINLITLRIVALAGIAVSCIMAYLIVREKTKSTWWGLVSLGLFSASYQAMDAYLDTAHSDSWFLGTALLGTYILDKSKSKTADWIGLLVLISSFWFKQHGALFAAGGVLYLTVKHGVKGSLPFWAVTVLLGPIFYVCGPLLFGSHFHYITWSVPSSWSAVTWQTILRPARYVIFSYGFLFIFGIWYVGYRIRQKQWYNDIVMIQFVFAMCSGIMGSLDWGSLNNVYIPMGIWLIITGTLGFSQCQRLIQTTKLDSICYFTVIASFALLFYNPVQFMIPSSANQTYREFVKTLNQLDGNVYAPWQGYLGKDVELYPLAHWVPLDDLIRGAYQNTKDNPVIRELLAPCIYPKGKAYLLTNFPLEKWPLFEFFTQYYVMEIDYGERFIDLKSPPRRFSQRWPRYLYRYSKEQSIKSGMKGST